MKIRAEFALSCENNRIRKNKKFSFLLDKLKKYKEKGIFIDGEEPDERGLG